MKSLLTRPILFTLLIGASAFAAHAQTFSGSFSGVANDSRYNATSSNPGNFDGVVVTGTFWLDLSTLPPPYAEEPDVTYTVLEPNQLKLSFSIPGHGTHVFDGEDAGSSLLEAMNGAAGQSITFAPDWTFPYWNARLVLAGGLFDGMDASTLRPGVVDLAKSGAYFFAGRELGASLSLTEVRFDGVSAVPEPAAWAAMLAGLALLAGVRARQGGIQRALS